MAILALRHLSVNLRRIQMDAMRKRLDSILIQRGEVDQLRLIAQGHLVAGHTKSRLSGCEFFYVAIRAIRMFWPKRNGTVILAPRVAIFAMQQCVLLAVVIERFDLHSLRCR